MNHCSAFLGVLAFYRAFRIAVPSGNARWFAALLFFFPSFVFWPSSIGKESWMVLAIGIAAYGSARILAGETSRGALWAILGMVLAYPVRVHISGMIAIALAFALFLRRSRPDGRRIGPGVRIAGVVFAVAIAGVFVTQADKFLQSSGLDTSQGLTQALEENASRTAIGANSDFSPVAAT